MKQFPALIGAVFAAVAASACCILPAVLGVAGAGALGFGAAFAPYRSYFMGFTVLLLAAAFYFTYRPAKTANCADGQCETGGTSKIKRGSRAALWAITAFTLGVMAYPTIAESIANTPANAEPVAVAPQSSKTAVFTVGKMTCASCAPELAQEFKKTPGVFSAAVDFKTKRATVRYDAARLDVSKLRSIIEKSGYSATI